MNMDAFLVTIEGKEGRRKRSFRTTTGLHWEDVGGRKDLPGSGLSGLNVRTSLVKVSQRVNRLRAQKSGR